MSPRTFQFHVYRFRFLAAVRTARRWIGQQTTRLVPRVWAGLVWTRNAVLAPLWISFELSIVLWESLERRFGSKHKLRTWHRALYCLALSVAIGCGLIVAMGWEISEIPLLLGPLHGLALFVTWKRGARWLGKMLGVRPVRAKSSAAAYARLDLGN